MTATRPDAGRADEAESARLAGLAWEAMRALVLENEGRKEACDALDLSFVRVKALLRIAEGGPVSQRSLAPTLGTDATYVTVAVDELERRGLVERRPDPDDRRCKVLTVTARGAADAAQAGQILARPPAPLAALPVADLAALASLLEPLAQRVRPPAAAPQAP
jgi:DNA-binding MarR family transcriptional regulator